MRKVEQRKKYSKMDKKEKERMEEGRMPKKIFTQEMEGMRQRGRPRKGWREQAEKDLQVQGVRRWRDLVIDKKKWTGIVQQTKVYSWL
jgi:hypothetical protein